MNTLLTILTSVIASGGAMGLIEFLIRRKDDTRKERNEILNDMKWLKEQSLKQEIATSQLKILNLIQHTPEDHRAIMSEAEHYFCELKADSWVFNTVSGWARKEKIDITGLSTQHDKNVKEQLCKK